MKNSIKKINLNHSFIFFIFSNILSLIIFKLNDYIFSLLICLIFILIIGVSHGSLDHIKGQRLFKILNIQQFYFFYFTYILIAISVIIIWILKPSISLLLFLIIASYHFGKEDTQFLINKHSILNMCLYFFKGLLIVLAPLFFHFNETINIFKFLLIENEAFYSMLAFIEKNQILTIGIILSTLSSIYLFLRNLILYKETRSKTMWVFLMCSY